MQVLPIGIQDFVQMRTDNLLYVDKTGKLLELIQNGSHKFRIIGTAGLRRKGKFSAGTGNDLEYYSFVRTLAAVDRADVALLLMDSNEPCTDQDKKIAAHVVEKWKGLILMMNKWDLIDTKNNKTDKFVKKIRDDMPFLNFAPVIFASVLNGRGLNKIIQTVLSVNENRKKRIPTNILNRLMRDVLAFDRLPSNKKGKTLKIYYASQAEFNHLRLYSSRMNPKLQIQDSKVTLKMKFVNSKILQEFQLEFSGEAKINQNKENNYSWKKFGVL